MNVSWKAATASRSPRNFATASCSGRGAHAPRCPRMSRMRDILGHLGAWAPRPEQLAVAKFLGEREAVAAFHETFIRELQVRLNLLYDGIDAMRRDGLPVRAITPQGAIYLSAQFNLFDGKIRTNEDIRKLLLEEAGFAVVPFQAFGLKQE